MAETKKPGGNFLSEFFGELAGGAIIAKVIIDSIKGKLAGDWSTKPSTELDEAAFVLWTDRLEDDEKNFYIEVLKRLSFNEQANHRKIMEQIFLHDKTTIEGKIEPQSDDVSGGEKPKPKKKVTYDYSKGIEACCKFVRWLMEHYPEPNDAAQHLRDVQLAQLAPLERWSRTALRKLKKLLEKHPPEEWWELIRNFPKDMSNANAVVAQLEKWSKQLEEHRAKLRRQREEKNRILFVFRGTFIFLTLLIGLALLAGGLLEVNRSQPKPKPTLEKRWQMDVDDYTKSTQPTYTPPLHDNIVGGCMIGAGTILMLGGILLLIIRPRRMEPEIIAPANEEETVEDEPDEEDTASNAVESTPTPREEV